MSDYPDYTTLTQIVGTEVTIPISIESVAVTLDVDIVAQTVGDLDINLAASDITLNVDIAAQSIGNIAVNIAASDITLDINIESSAVTLNVDITAQTIGNITIDIETQSVAVYNPPDWQGKLGNSVDLSGIVTSKAAGSQWLVATRNVTAGKTWVIYAFAAMLDAIGGNVSGFIWNDTDETVLACGGGANGFSVVLPKPARVAAGKNIDLYITHYGADVGNLYAIAWGYEE